MTVSETTSKTGEDTPSKPKRVRTGCLTCRERHLKCDEALPHCNNCRKSNRECKRGLRLNFIDIWTERPSTIVTSWGTSDWKVEFTDESREIASEYQGGRERYKSSPPSNTSTLDPSLATGHASHHSRRASVLPTLSTTNSSSSASSLSQHPPPMQHATLQPYLDPSATFQHQFEHNAHAFPSTTRRESIVPIRVSNPSSVNGGSHAGSVNGNVSAGRSGSISTWPIAHQENDVLEDEKQEYLDTAEKTLFMQVFVEEVGAWMDSMDPMKHFSRLLPFHSLGEPMLLNAFLACGARHLTLVNSTYTEQQALHYYDTATRHLLSNLQNPNRDTIICATTAVILNVYEIMSERALQRMNHIAGARALIKECGWTARSQGIGGACFWLNVGLEVLSCLHFNWQVAWDPDEWGVDMDMTREEQNCREEIWTHRMLYLVAKVCNFRATAARQYDGDIRTQQARAQQRYEEWYRLKSMIDAWNEGIPRTMHPMSYVHAFSTASKSCFPEVWLIKRTTIVARLFYHTAMVLMGQIHPLCGPEYPEVADMLRRHSQMVCGIVAHVKDRGVASVAIRSLAHAAEVLTDRREQEEVLEIFDRINKQTGWRIGFVYVELKRCWGWQEAPSPQQLAQTHTVAKQQEAMAKQQSMSNRNESSPHQLRTTASLVPPPVLPPTNQIKNVNNMSNGLTSGHNHNHAPAAIPPAQTTPPARPPSGIPNPMYAKADFSLPQHPYQNFYVAPNQHHMQHDLPAFSLGVGYNHGHDHYSSLHNMGHL